MKVLLFLSLVCLAYISSVDVAYTGGSETDQEGRGPSSETTRKPGQKAWDKCVEYQHLICGSNDTALPHSILKLPSDRCNPRSQIEGGPATEYEVPHTVLLGYRNRRDGYGWLCTGSLISDKFILTALQCVYNKYTGSPIVVALGMLNHSDITAKHMHELKTKIWMHPLFEPNAGLYHDIALLELKEPITLDHTIVPACLHAASPIDDDTAVVTGWGHTKSSDSDKEYSPVLEKGFGGAPLQVKNKELPCMYTVIGVTSIATCGVVGHPSVYTRVAHYLDWIESIVWP